MDRFRRGARATQLVPDPVGWSSAASPKPEGGQAYPRRSPNYREWNAGRRPEDDGGGGNADRGWRAMKAEEERAKRRQKIWKVRGFDASVLDESS